ncbi:MAG: chromosome partitioning protein ParB [Dethiosulfovibrio peptidovorans]|nr:MAG: chromosome partitioning protein ParB [Dethiosulfovibrio peptidovorans]
MNDRQLTEIELSRIRTNPHQPRRHFDEDEIRSLAESVREVGLIQPVVVRPNGDFYELIAGERRLRACHVAGFDAIPAVIVEVPDTDQQIMALVENIHRKDLSAVEEAASLKEILDRTGWGQSELARRIGRSQASVANKLRLLKLEEAVQAMIIEGHLGERAARALIRLAPALQIAAAKKAVELDYTAKEVELLVTDLLAGGALEPNGTDTSRQLEGILIQKEKTPEPLLSQPIGPSRNNALSFSGPEGPTGELLQQLANLVEVQRRKGVPVVWKVRELAQSELIVEIVVDLKKQLLMEEGRVEDENHEQS